MANYEAVSALNLETSLEEIDAVAGGFRDFYANNGACELGRVTLVSAHDPTIHFTNSTTSVMKPYLRGELPLNEVLYLTQPAMGSQGINYWRATRELGPYASYFASLGSLYEPRRGSQALEDMAALATGAWGFEEGELRFEVHESDNTLVELLDSAGLPVRVTDGDTAPFRHFYGMPGVSGCNANLCMVDGERTSLELGNLTRIQTDDDAATLAWEVSFDSTPVMAGRRSVDHPIATLPATAIISGGEALSDTGLVAADCAAISAALTLEQVEPRAKGKSGILRKFFREYVELASEQHSEADTIDMLIQTARAEIRARASLSPEVRPSVDQNASEAITRKWVGQLWPQK